MKKLTFIALVSQGSGELTTAINVAEQLKREDIDISFITTKSGKKFIHKKFDTYIFSKNKLKNITWMQNFFARRSTDLLIIADYYLFHIDRNVSKSLWMGWLKDTNIPVISFDNFGLGRNYPSVPYISFPERLPPRKYKIEFKVPAWIKYLITPCPPFSGRNENKGILYGKLYDIKKIPRREKNEKMLQIFFPIPKWALGYAETSNNRYYSILFSILMRYLKDLGSKVNLICIAPLSSFIYNEPVPKNVKVRFYRFLPPEIYTRYLLSSDLLITDNILSSTIGKAVLGNVPVMVLKNSVRVDKKNEKVELTSPLNFKINPNFEPMIREYPSLTHAKFFYSIYKEIHKDDLFGQTFIEAEIFDETKTKELIKKILLDDDFKEGLRLKQRKYIKRISKLPTMAKLISDMVMS